MTITPKLFFIALTVIISSLLSSLNHICCSDSTDLKVSSGTFLKHSVNDYTQSSIGMSGSIDIGSVNLIKLGSSASFNISCHVGFSWCYRNNYTKPKEENKVCLIRGMKNCYSGFHIMVNPNIAFLNNRISVGPLLGFKHVAHKVTIEDMKHNGGNDWFSVHTIAFVCGAQLRVMFAKWIGITVSYQYELGLKNFTKDHSKIMKKIKYTNHNMITVGITFVPYSKNKIYTGITVSLFSFNKKTVSLSDMSDDNKRQILNNSNTITQKIQEAIDDKQQYSCK